MSKCAWLTSFLAATERSALADVERALRGPAARPSRRFALVGPDFTVVSWRWVGHKNNPGKTPAMAAAAASRRRDRTTSRAPAPQAPTQTCALTRGFYHWSCRLSAVLPSPS